MIPTPFPNAIPKHLYPNTTTSTPPLTLVLLEEVQPERPTTVLISYSIRVVSHESGGRRYRLLTISSTGHTALVPGPCRRISSIH